VRGCKKKRAGAEQQPAIIKQSCCCWMLSRKVDQMSRGEQTTIACHEPTASAGLNYRPVRRRLHRLQHLSRAAARRGDQKKFDYLISAALFISCSLRTRHSNCMRFFPLVKLGKNALTRAFWCADDSFDTQLFLTGHYFLRAAIIFLEWLVVIWCSACRPDGRSRF
jgi:hypothetical protein